jgi:hypothetical protein
MEIYRMEGTPFLLLCLIGLEMAIWFYANIREVIIGNEPKLQKVLQ